MSIHRPAVPYQRGKASVGRSAAGTPPGRLHEPDPALHKRCGALLEACGGSVLDCFAAVADPRDPRGRWHSLLLRWRNAPRPDQPACEELHAIRVAWEDAAA